MSGIVFGGVVLFFFNVSFSVCGINKDLILSCLANQTI